MSTKKSIFDVPAEDKKMLNQIFCRVGPLFFGFGGPSSSVGYVCGIMPAIKRYYLDKGDREGFLEAIARHNVRYNITQNVGTICFGLVAAMEYQNSIRDDFPTESINSLKTALQGPMSGIGDAIFWGVVRTVAASIALSFVGDGNVFAPILFIILYQVPSLITKYTLLFVGFNLGEDFIVDAYESGIMGVVTKAISTLGLLMVGAMTASTVRFSINYQIMVEGQGVPVQPYIDDLFKGILPLLITLGVKKLFDKGMNITVATFGLLGVGILLGLIGIV